MKIYCKLSGVMFEPFSSFFTPEKKEKKWQPYFSTLQCEGIHPLFTLDTVSLLSLTSQWAARKLSEKEKRVLFLSLLHATSLVEFTVTPTPSLATIEQNMEPLAKVLAWQSTIATHLLKLPKFRITNDTKRLENVSHWIATWQELKKAWSTNYKEWQEQKEVQDVLELREKALEKLIKSSSKTTDNYAGTLALWAFDATGLPNKTKLQKETRAYWMKLFKLRKPELYNAPHNDLEEMLNWFEDNLSHGSIQAATVLKHLRKQLFEATNGLNSALGLIDGKTFSFLDDVETHNRNIIASEAPIEEPKESDCGPGKLYPTRVAFLKARAAYNMSLSNKDKEKELISFLEKKAKESDISQVTEEELFAASTDEDIDTLTTEFKNVFSHGDNNASE